MTDIRIPLSDAGDYWRATYGILFKGTFVHEVSGQSQNRYAPHRIQVWSNLNRPNPHPGETRYTDFGSIGGDGKYLDPHNKATDNPTSVTIGAESSCISAHGDGTGTVASGQVWGDTLTVGDTLTLVAPSGTEYGPYTLEYHRFKGLSLTEQ